MNVAWVDPTLGRAEGGGGINRGVDQGFDVGQGRCGIGAGGNVDRGQQAKATCVGIGELAADRQRGRAGVGNRQNPRRGAGIGHRHRRTRSLDRGLEVGCDHVLRRVASRDILGRDGIGDVLAADPHRDIVTGSIGRIGDRHGAHNVGAAGGIERKAERVGGGGRYTVGAGEGGLGDIAAGRQVLRRDGDRRRGNAAGRVAIKRGQNCRTGSAVVHQIQPVELRGTHHRGDLIAQRRHVGLDLGTIDVGFLRRHDLAFHLGQEVSDGFRGLPRHGDGR